MQVGRGPCWGSWAAIPSAHCTPWPALHSSSLQGDSRGPESLAHGPPTFPDSSPSYHTHRGLQGSKYTGHWCSPRTTFSRLHASARPVRQTAEPIPFRSLAGHFLSLTEVQMLPLCGSPQAECITAPVKPQPCHTQLLSLRGIPFPELRMSFH